MLMPFHVAVRELRSESACSASTSPITAPIRLQVRWGSEVITFEVDPSSKISELMSAFCLRQSCELSRTIWYHQGTLIRPNESLLQVEYITRT